MIVLCVRTDDIPTCSFESFPKHSLKFFNVFKYLGGRGGRGGYQGANSGYQGGGGGGDFQGGGGRGGRDDDRGGGRRGGGGGNKFSKRFVFSV